MKRILAVENEVILSFLKVEFDKIDIAYSVEYFDSVIYPTGTTELTIFAYIVSDENNSIIINEIYNNIKETIVENKKKEISNYTNPIIKKLFFGFFVVIIVVIMVSQQITLKKLQSSLAVTDESHIYEWSSDLHEVKAYTPNHLHLLGKSIDNDRNQIFERVESYFPNNISFICEDLNQNYYYEKQTQYKKDLKQVEYISTKDDGIFDKIIYYNNTIIKNTLIYNVDTNSIEIK